MRNNIFNHISQYKNPRWLILRIYKFNLVLNKDLLRGLVWGISLGLIPYLWHMYV